MHVCFFILHLQHGTKSTTLFQGSRVRSRPSQKFLAFNLPFSSMLSSSPHPPFISNGSAIEHTMIRSTSPPVFSLSEAFNQSHSQKNKLKNLQSSALSPHTPSSSSSSSSQSFKTPVSAFPMNSRPPPSKEHHEICRTLSDSSPRKTLQPLGERKKAARSITHSKSSDNIRASHKAKSRTKFDKDLPPLPPADIDVSTNSQQFSTSQPFFLVSITPLISAIHACYRCGGIFYLKGESQKAPLNIPF